MPSPIAPHFHHMEGIAMVTFAQSWWALALRGALAVVFSIISHGYLRRPLCCSERVSPDCTTDAGSSQYNVPEIARIVDPRRIVHC